MKHSLEDWPPPVDDDLPLGELVLLVGEPDVLLPEGAVLVVARAGLVQDLLHERVRLGAGHEDKGAHAVDVVVLLRATQVGPHLALVQPPAGHGRGLVGGVPGEGKRSLSE